MDDIYVVQMTNPYLCDVQRK